MQTILTNVIFMWYQTTKENHMTLLDFAKKHGYDCVSISLHSSAVGDYGYANCFYTAFVHRQGIVYMAHGTSEADAIKKAHSEAQAAAEAHTVRELAK